MEIIIKREDLLKVLLKTQGIIEKRNVISILENVLIDAKKDRMNYAATNLEVGIYGNCEVEVIEEGRVVLLAKKTLEIARELPEEKVSLKQKESAQGGGSIEIVCGKVVFNLISMDPKEFPSLPTREDIDFFPVDIDKIREMIKKTIFATSLDEKRHNLSGVFFEKDGKTIRMVATDGHRLSMIEKEDEETEDFKLDKGIIFPRKGLNELKRILEDDKDNKKVYIGIKENNCVFKIERLSMMMRLLEGEFPDYRRLIPKDNDKKFVINKSRFINSLRRVSLISEERLKPVKFYISTGKIELRASNADYGEAYDEMELDYGGPDLMMAFNAGYFVEALNILDGEEVLVELKDAVSPAVLKSNNSNHISIIMPMRA
ncbi:MAG: DNA polymerase III subunit beta [Desulfobacterales bacterium]|nr:DNA polymerase III subunit beta [Desulfobacterales bacterium]